MNKNNFLKLLIIAAMVVIAAFTIWPVENKLKGGLDIIGGVSFIYDIDTELLIEVGTFDFAQLHLQNELANHALRFSHRDTPRFRCAGAGRIDRVQSIDIEGQIDPPPRFTLHHLPGRPAGLPLHRTGQRRPSSSRSLPSAYRCGC